MLGPWGSWYCSPCFRACLKFSEIETKQLLQFAVHVSSHRTFNQSKSGGRRQSVCVRGWWLSTPAEHRVAWGLYKKYRRRGLSPERGCQKPGGAALCLHLLRLPQRPWGSATTGRRDAGKAVLFQKSLFDQSGVGGCKFHL